MSQKQYNLIEPLVGRYYKVYYLHRKKNTSTMINADKYADFMIDADKNEYSMFNTENF